MLLPFMIGRFIKFSNTGRNNALTNENDETFNFGIKNGVRGFFTNPSRADDSFIPFIINPEIVLNTTMTLEYNKEISTNIDAKVGSVIYARINNYYYLFGMILENEIKE